MNVSSVCKDLLKSDFRRRTARCAPMRRDDARTEVGDGCQQIRRLAAKRLILL
jgi:hypothetical protein